VFAETTDSLLGAATRRWALGGAGSSPRCRWRSCARCDL